MSVTDILHQILHVREQYETKLNGDDFYDDILSFQEELLAWQQQITKRLNKFVEEKLLEIKNKYIESIRKRIEHLDALRSRVLSNLTETNRNENYPELLDNVANVSVSIKICYPKQLDFSYYCKLTADSMEQVQSSLRFIPRTNSVCLSAYKLFTTLPTKSNITSLFSVQNRLLVYCDHDASSASLHIFDLKSYLEHLCRKGSCVKSRVPCTAFHGKVLHMEYCPYVKGFLVATGAKLFTIGVSSVRRKYRITECLDIVRRNFGGVLQKFACHPILAHVIYFLINKLTHCTIIRAQLDSNFNIQNQWDYPTNDNINAAKRDFQLKSINDFCVGNNVLIFSVTYASNDNPLDQYYEFHVRSCDMTLQHHLTLNTSFCPIRIYIIPQDYVSSESGEEQFMVIFSKSKSLSLYGINSSISDSRIELHDEIVLDTEPEYVQFDNSDLSTLLIRNLFHIAIYKRTQSS